MATSSDDERRERLLRRFEARFPGRAGSEVVVVRAPGRVNLIGEHVDYSGFGVLPMAIEAAAWVACCLGGEAAAAAFSFSNLNDAQWPDGSMGVAQALDEPLDRAHKHWSHYVVAGIKGVCLESGFDGAAAATAQLRQRGACFLVDSDVPPGSGLSSSSALLCAASLAVVELFGLDSGSTERLAELCARAEHHVGSESGGMDQAISFLARRGVAKHIRFDPLRSADVLLPAGYVWLLANSGVAHSVSDGGGYNMRVSECRLAAAVLARRLGFDALLTGDCRGRKLRLDDVLRARVEATGARFDPDADLTAQLLDMAAQCAALLDRNDYRLADVAELLQLDAAEVRARFVAARMHAEPEQLVYQLRQRAQHVFEEAARVYRFSSLAAHIARAAPSDVDALVVQLGQLLSDSHRSCRDLFDCSCPELNHVVDACLQLGALGSRLTGAGWGGWTVSLLREADLPSFLRAAAEKNLVGVIVTSPGQGAQRIS